MFTKHFSIVTFKLQMSNLNHKHTLSSTWINSVAIYSESNPESSPERYQYDTVFIKFNFFILKFNFCTFRIFFFCFYHHQNNTVWYASHPCISLNPNSICSICDIKFLDTFLHAMNTCHSLLSKKFIIIVFFYIVFFIKKWSNEVC